MKKYLNKIKNLKFQTRGFVIPFSLLISTIILTISLGVSMILIKEIFFSKLSRDSAVAYYAADEALDCAEYLNDKYVTDYTGDGGEINHGLFPYDSLDDATSTLSRRGYDDLPVYTDSSSNALTPDDIVCNTAKIFENVTSITEVGGKYKTTYEMKMNLDSFGTNKRCATVVVDNTSGVTRYSATGYNNCNSSNRVERSLTR